MAIQRRIEVQPGIKPEKYIETPVVAAPMAGITDSPFRIMCRSEGAGCVFTEFLSAAALSRGCPRTRAMAQIDDREMPVFLQIFGNNVKEIVAAVKWAENERRYAGIDLNFGCPAPKVARQECGASLLRDPERVGSIVKAAVEATHLQVSAKIRLGINAQSVVAVPVARIIEQSGGAFITVHARTLAQGYSGKAQWEEIRRVRDAVSIPVIGNGDVVDGPTARSMMASTECDYVMIGRALRGAPYVLGDIRAYLEDGISVPPDPLRGLQAFSTYLKLAGEQQIAELGRMKQQAMYFTKGVPGSAQARAIIAMAQDVEKIREAVESLGRSQGVLK